MVRYSLDVLGSHQGITLVYTAPAKGDLIRTTAELTGFLDLLRPHASSPWIWIVDCAGMTTAHYTNLEMCQRVYELLKTEYQQTLRGLWLMRTNTWMKGLLKIFKMPVPIQHLPKDRLELLVTMQKAAVPDTIINRLLAA